MTPEQAKQIAQSILVDPYLDRTKEGMFRDHRCWKCNDGERACPAGNPRQCEYPRARND